VAVKIHEVDQNTSEWMQLRSGKYTGSNADKLLRFGAIDYALTEQSDFKGNYHTKRGHILEEECVELYEKITGNNVDRPGFVTNDKYISCGYSPDGLCGETLIEVKCFNTVKHMLTVNGAIPFKVEAQIHFGLFICELKQAQLLIYNPEIENPKDAFKIINIKARKSIQDNFKRILTKPKMLERV
jgi:hypothetical protein